MQSVLGIISVFQACNSALCFYVLCESEANLSRVCVCVCVCVSCIIIRHSLACLQTGSVPGCLWQVATSIPQLQTHCFLSDSEDFFFFAIHTLILCKNPLKSDALNSDYMLSDRFPVPIRNVWTQHHVVWFGVTVLCASHHVRPVVDEDLRGPVRAQLQGLLHQRDVLHSSAGLDAKRGCNHQLGLRNTQRRGENQIVSRWSWRRIKKQEPALPSRQPTWQTVLLHF